MRIMIFFLRFSIFFILFFSKWKQKVLHANLKLIYPLKSEKEKSFFRKHLLKNLAYDGADFLSGLKVYKKLPKSFDGYPKKINSIEFKIDPASMPVLEKASYAPIRPHFLNEFLYNHLRSVDSYHYSTFISNPRFILRLLDQGKLFCLLADQDYRHSRPIRDHFLEQPVCCNPIPSFILKHRPLTPVFISWIEATEKQRILFASEIIFSEKSSGEQAIRIFNQWLENHIKKNAECWYGWLHRRFLAGQSKKNNIYSH
jgi:KDO2-lipid IV(A) lauroyltransferase